MGGEGVRFSSHHAPKGRMKSQRRRRKRTVFVRLGKHDHVVRQDLWDPTHARGDDKQATRSSLDERCSKRLCEGRVEEDLTPLQDLSKICARERRRSSGGIPGLVVGI